MENNKSGLTLNDFLLAFTKNILKVLVITIIFIIVGICYGIFIKKPVHSVTATVMTVSTNNEVGNYEKDPLEEAFKIVTTIKEFMQDDVVILKTAEKIYNSEKKYGISVLELRKIIKDGLTVTNNASSLRISVNFTTNSYKIKDSLIEAFVVETVNTIIEQAIELSNQKIINDEGELVYRYSHIAHRIDRLSTPNNGDVIIKRGLVKICIASFFLGAMVGYTFALIDYSSKKKNLTVKES